MSDQWPLPGDGLDAVYATDALGPDAFRSDPLGSDSLTSDAFGRMVRPDTRGPGARGPGIRGPGTRGAGSRGCDIRDHRGRDVREQDRGMVPGWDFENDLARLLRSAAPKSAVPLIPRQRGARRRPGRLIRCGRWFRTHGLRRAGPWVRLLSLLMGALTAVIVGMLSVLGGLISYDPMRRLASPGAPHGLAGWWPLLVYGPWLVASLSILRAALYRRRAMHSWAVVVLFSVLAVCLCVAHAPETPTGMAVAGLPPVTALVSFHQLVRQITLTSPPRHAMIRRRHRGHAARPALHRPG